VRDGEVASAEDVAVGQRLALARRETKLTQAQAANHIGVAQSRIAKLETGTRRLLFSEAVALADLYRCRLTAFVPTQVDASAAAPRPRSKR
jgi:transcriptional regulator with XRE-family HTH domain